MYELEMYVVEITIGHESTIVDPISFLFFWAFFGLSSILFPFYRFQIEFDLPVIFYSFERHFFFSLDEHVLRELGLLLLHTWERDS